MDRNKLFKIGLLSAVLLIYLLNVILYFIDPNKDTGSSSDDQVVCLNTWKYYTNSGDIMNIDQSCSTPDNDSTKWCMKNAYTIGRGKEGVNWVKTEDPNDSRCLTNWTLYNPDGSVKEQNIKSTTTLGTTDSQSWCPTNVFFPGQLRNRGWRYCAN